MDALRLAVSTQLKAVQGRPLIVAFSGGGDSLALLHLVAEVQPGSIVAAHLDHGLRPESGAEAELLGGWAAAAGAKFVVKQAPVVEKAHLWGVGLEAAGRRLRYAWLRRLAQQTNAVVLTGHNLDDVAETVLLRLVAGTSPSGLGGPRLWRGKWVYRPLLAVSRKELRAYLVAKGLTWLEDSSNEDTRFARNWVRQQVLPLLQERNPRVVEALQRLAMASGELREWSRKKARRLGTAGLRGFPIDVRFQAWARGWRSAQPAEGSRFTRRHFELCEEWQERGGERLQLPGGVWVKRTPQGHSFAGSAVNSCGIPRDSVAEALDFSDPPPWRLALPGWGLDLRVEPCSQAQPPQPWQADLNPPGGFPIAGWHLRGRQEGDRFGSAKLKKYLLQWGVSRERRDTIPLLCDEQDRPIWVIGHRVRQEYLAPLGTPGWRFHFTPQGDAG